MLTSRFFLSVILAAVSVVAQDGEIPGAVSVQPPPYSIIDCPEACPCCKWCEPLARCRRPHLSVPTYNTVRNIIGCESLPDDTPVCPIGKCSDNCLCRETLMKQLESALMPSRRTVDEVSSATADPEPTYEPEPARPKRPLSLVQKIRPWYMVKPRCEEICPCGPDCVPLRPDCRGGYSSDWFGQPYPAARKAVGCNVYPATTPLCPPGDCGNECICRELLYKKLYNIFLNESG